MKSNIQVERSEESISFPDLPLWLKDNGSCVWALADVSLYINEFRDDLTAIYHVSVVPGSGHTVAGAHIPLPQRWDSVLVTWGSSPCVMAHTCLTLVKTQSQESVCMSFCLCCLYRSKATMRGETYKFQPHCVSVDKEPPKMIINLENWISWDAFIHQSMIPETILFNGKKRKPKGHWNLKIYNKCCFFRRAIMSEAWPLTKVQICVTKAVHGR